MAKEKPKTAFAYLRTSSATNVGVDKDSAKRQREATFAKRAGFEILAEFNDEAVSGADSLESRPGLRSHAGAHRGQRLPDHHPGKRPAGLLVT